MLLALCIPNVVITYSNWILLILAFTEEDLNSLRIVRDDIARSKVLLGTFIACTIIFLAEMPFIAYHDGVSII